jgi:hypothetical protein
MLARMTLHFAFYSLQNNGPDLLQLYDMGMTSLHILCANPAVTKDMSKQLHIKNIEAAAVRNVNELTGKQ